MPADMIRLVGRMASLKKEERQLQVFFTIDERYVFGLAFNVFVRVSMKNGSSFTRCCEIQREILRCNGPEVGLL